MLETRHHWLPVAMAIYLPVSCFITYSIAVGNGNVEPGFPYISDTGTIPPESCVFGQLMNIGAVLGGIIIYIRYRHIQLHCEQTPGTQGMIRLNTAAYVIGILTVFGVSVVGNFQETNVIVVHLLGATLAFVVGFVYFVLQTIISFKVAALDFKIPGNTVNTRRVRVLLIVLDFIFLLLTGIFAQLSRSKGPGQGIPSRKWSEDNPGYSEHLVATISEWLVAFVSVIYFSTFYPEFKHFRVRPPKVEYYPDTTGNVMPTSTEQIPARPDRQTKYQTFTETNYV
ncbi:DNA damage-regulated autophagy modulator protein 1-like isoform X2 [Mya arenaria]|uniref:DNA damage-regulated autophagy modulator protein 1-like isoform X2 n=1 Tax=Mya arenaria TaxID=6604 RepID=UPI0022E5A4F8|nr:DNA damage-regulated autophagy modulator protein 1-like isoform X2 [Mya arenaria]XP_052797648.1 DNA damage-regulated autophagy modulator protein 1-like isoform X2 [Mya arenaria]